MKKSLFIFVISCLFACGKAKTTSFNGKWIEITTKKDTIIFDPTWNNGDRRGFIFNREREMRYGYLLPKIGAGIYYYTIKADTISLLNSFSSCIFCYKAYHFTKAGDKLMIENFYDPNFKGTIQTFEKVYK